MLVAPVLKKKEQQLLLTHYRKSGTGLIRQRAHTILLAQDGHSAPKIGCILFVNENTVRGWINDFADRRIASIFPAYKGNTNASKLTKEQREEIKETLQNPPSESGPGDLPFRFWSVAGMKDYLKAEYGVVYESDRSYHHLLAISGYSFKLPEGFDKRRDGKLVAKRMKEIAQEIDALRKKGYTPFAADECSLCFETEYRRAWLKKGEKTILKVNREKIRQHYFGALNLDSHTHELIRLDWQNTKTITGALLELSHRYPNQKLAIIWDNAKWHRSKELRSLLGKGNPFEHLHFVWLPPYAPDQNPQEHVWKVGKEAAANQSPSSFESLKRSFESAISYKKFNYSISGI